MGFVSTPLAPSTLAFADSDQTAHVVFRRKAEPEGAMPRGRELMVKSDGSYLFTSAELGGVPELRHHLGLLDGRSSFVTVLDDPREGTSFTSLRAALFGLGEAHLAVLSSASQILAWDEGHQFCARDATPLVGVESERAKRCPTCGTSYYPRIAPCTIVLVHDGDRVLLAHKPKMPFFALVAGFVEAGESLEECVAREVAEETGVQVDDITYFGSQTWPFPQQIMVGFFARYRGGEIVVDQTELDEVKWFERSSMPPVPPPISIAGKLIQAWVEKRMPR